MRAAFAAAKSYQVNHADWFEGRWSGLRSGTEADMLAFTATGLPRDHLVELGRGITTVPRGMAVDPKVARFLDERRTSIEAGDGISWATAEALALASLLSEGTPVRLGGQDTVRGTFTQRHLELHDQTTGARHLVLTGAAAAGGVSAEIHNTPLIENAVLCFEYGISLADPHRLVIWEAQFGEFLNVAQAVFDQCIACGEDRWLRASGLVILLPHGLDGGGPDHSTGRPERLLAACAGANIQVANVSTPANFFHLLRRQMHRPFRKPLVVLSPKFLLRHKACVSRLAEFEDGTGFRTVIARRRGARSTPRRALHRQGLLRVAGGARRPQARDRNRPGAHRAAASLSVGRASPTRWRSTPAPRSSGARRSRRTWATSCTCAPSWKPAPAGRCVAPVALPSPRRRSASNTGTRLRSPPTWSRRWCCPTNSGVIPAKRSAERESAVHRSSVLGWIPGLRTDRACRE